MSSTNTSDPGVGFEPICGTILTGSEWIENKPAFRVARPYFVRYFAFQLDVFSNVELGYVSSVLGSSLDWNGTRCGFALHSKKIGFLRFAETTEHTVSPEIFGPDFRDRTRFEPLLIDGVYCKGKTVSPEPNDGT